MKNLVTREDEPRHYFQWKKPKSRVEIFYNDVKLASSTNTLLIKEVGKEIYDGVYYFPKEDIASELLSGSETQTHCPIKGEASYLSLSYDTDQVKDIAWYYGDPIPKSKVIKDLVAFYADKVTIVIKPE